MLHEPMMMPQGGAMSEVEVRPLLTREEVGGVGPHPDTLRRVWWGETWSG